MKFLCLICAEKVMEQMPVADAARHFQEYARFTQWVKETGHFIGANRLKPAATATTVRVRGRKVFVSDGPFAETKEQIGGYYLVEARDLKAAIQVASRIPGARRGCVELREIAEDAQTRALGFEIRERRQNRRVVKRPAASAPARSQSVDRANRPAKRLRSTPTQRPQPTRRIRGV